MLFRSILYTVCAAHNSSSLHCRVSLTRTIALTEITGVPYTPLGNFDKTFDYDGEGFVPTNHGTQDRTITATHLDKTYYELMSKCKYMLTPAGDAPWYVTQ